ncbi:N-acetylmuramoyl-L-alanine amidase [Sporomusa sp.]|uniref:N-acetylmuramoyl-L-alanine amidase family protein n=1 Tax=Sporomusa sp. TaxID=2078658 RepID=UPI002BD7D7C2|nr:N-acetylmuramoyl-L-alanine amidase [Sporomusa sp.]HWR08221.1 N-acetylmuramoyl-L-alanine amidase [Sporomusa sp.]
MAKIFINPGHAPNGRPDPGAVNPITGLREADVVATVGSLVDTYLCLAGCETKILQSNSLDEVINAANAWRADLFVSIHCNSVDSPAPSGAETWYWFNSVKSKGLAGCIQQQIVSSLPVADRGLKEAMPGRSLYVLKYTDMPSALVELAFISNAEDEQLLADRQDEFARAVARGVTDCLNK